MVVVVAVEKSSFYIGDGMSKSIARLLNMHGYVDREEECFSASQRRPCNLNCPFSSLFTDECYFLVCPLSRSLLRLDNELVMDKLSVLSVASTGDFNLRLKP